EPVSCFCPRKGFAGGGGAAEVGVHKSLAGSAGHGSSISEAPGDQARGAGLPDAGDALDIGVWTHHVESGRPCQAVSAGFGGQREARDCCGSGPSC
ncbi:unnamed protein product, partial [Symbiodinium necroappetens]